jgi:hypothetical protein
MWGEFIACFGGAVARLGSYTTTVAPAAAGWHLDGSRGAIRFGKRS